MNNGWIKLYRKLIDDHLWTETTPKQKTVMITILLMANSQAKDWNRIGTSYHVEPGEFVTSLKSIAEKAGVGISPDNVRSSLKFLKDSGFLTWKSTNKNRLITIANWGKYQGSPKQDSKQDSGKIPDEFRIDSESFTTNKKLRSKEVKNKELKHNVEKRSSDQLKGQVHEVIAYLNSQTSKHFKANSKDTVKLISARLRDGYTVDDFKKVIDIKTPQWAGTDMDKFLRPSTLFAPKHFESYLNERPIKQNELNFNGERWTDSYDTPEPPVSQSSQAQQETEVSPEIAKMKFIYNTFLDHDSDLEAAVPAIQAKRPELSEEDIKKALFPERYYKTEEW